MTDEDVEKIIKRNMNLQMNLAGIRADFEEALQRTWVNATTWRGLTDEEVAELSRHELWVKNFIRQIEEKLRIKNT